MDPLVVLVIVTALLFDFTNGFHDTANAVATSIATGALSPRAAVLLSGVLNLVGAFLSVQVAPTISSGLVDEAKITPTVIFAGLVGAILWNLVTWLLGLPVVVVPRSVRRLDRRDLGGRRGGHGDELSRWWPRSSSRRCWPPRSPGSSPSSAPTWPTGSPSGPDRSDVGQGFKVGQIVSASMVSLAHGTNDAQKTMGIITLTLITAGTLPQGSSPPLWVILSAGLAIALGTAFGGWRIIRTLGMRITEIHPLQGFAAQTSSASVILVSSHLGFPLSTTQVCSGAIFGAGAGRRLARVHWGVAGQMAIAWTLTLPSAAIVGGLAAQVALMSTLGTVLVALVAVAIAAGIYLLSRRNPIDAGNVDEVPADPRPSRPPPERRIRCTSTGWPSARSSWSPSESPWASPSSSPSASACSPPPPGARTAHSSRSLPSRAAPPDRPRRPEARPSTARKVTAWMCFLACGLSVAYGLSIIVAR